MKRIIARIGKTGKRITGILAFITGIFGCWEIYQNYSTKNISGKWNLRFEVKKCNHTAYIGDIHTQIAVFSQNDNSVTGMGEKWSYNGKQLPFDAHRKLEYSGTVCGNEFKAIYKLHGLLRDSEGQIEVKVSNNGRTMEGTFSGTIGNDSGIITGEKME